MRKYHEGHIENGLDEPSFYDIYNYVYSTVLSVQILNKYLYIFLYNVQSVNVTIIDVDRGEQFL